MKRLRRNLGWLLAAWMFFAAYSRADNRKRPLTVKDSIEAAQFVYPYGTSPVLISPDGTKYVAVLERGDLARNGCWIQVLSGGTESLEAARNVSVARLFSKSTASATELIKDVRWLYDNEHVTFLWDDGWRPREVVSVDVRNHEIEMLAHYATPIAGYDVSRDGQTIIFTAESQHNASHELSLERKGFAVADQSIWSILEGDFDGWTPDQHYDTFILSRRTRVLSRVHEPRAIWSTPPELLSLSPDGRFAITVRPAPSVPAEWDGYTDHLFKDDYLPPARRNPRDPNRIRQYFIVDVNNGTARPLWNAPQNPPAKTVWSPDSRSLAVGPTFLPLPSEDQAGLAGRAIVEVDAKTGHYVSILSPDESVVNHYTPVRWDKDGVLYLSGGGSSDANSAQAEVRKADGKWTRVAISGVDLAQARELRIELREDLNTPPALYAVNRMTHTAKLILDPNKQLKLFTLGRVELVHWKATDGRPWTGTLYYPVHYEAGREFPLVIQTHGYSAIRFLLDGPFTTVFAAQALANRDIAVLQVGGPDGPVDDFIVSPTEPKVYVAGFEGAIDHFVESGIVDRSKVGIIGFSRTGWYVEYMLTHSQYELAAAEVADNLDGSYLQYVLWDPAGRSEFEADNGSRPIGDGVETWLRSAPGFNTDKIHTPLRMEIDTGPVDSILRDWEVFSNLRYTQKPVELFAVPDIQHGVHILQNPAQRLASQGGTVDWFCFWLKNEEDPATAKRQEYDRWRTFRTLGERD